MEVPSSSRAYPEPLADAVLIIRYLVLVMGFYFAPNRGQGDIEVNPDGALPTIGQTLTRLWA